MERASTWARRRGIRCDKDGYGAGVAEKAKTKTRSARGELACSGRRIRRRENRKEKERRNKKMMDENEKENKKEKRERILWFKVKLFYTFLTSEVGARKPVF